MKCANCGVDVDSSAAFCPSCGRPADSAPANVSRGQVSLVSAGLQRNVAGALCYLMGLLTGFFFLVADPYKRDHFVRFHAFQSIFLSAGWFAIYLLLAVFLAVLPAGLWRAIWLMQSAAGFGFFVLWLFLMFKAYSNEEFRLPYIGDLAAKQA